MTEMTLNEQFMGQLQKPMCLLSAWDMVIFLRSQSQSLALSLSLSPSSCLSPCSMHCRAVVWCMPNRSMCCAIGPFKAPALCCTCAGITGGRCSGIGVQHRQQGGCGFSSVRIHAGEQTPLAMLAVSTSQNGGLDLHRGWAGQRPRVAGRPCFSKRQGIQVLWIGGCDNPGIVSASTGQGMPSIVH